MRSLTLSLPLLALAAQLSVAGPLATPVGTGDLGSLVNDEQAVLISWTFSGTFANVEIAASLVSLEAGQTGTAYLMDQVGPGTDTSHQLATTPFTFAQVATYDDVSYVTLFSGLTLGPGTYFVVLASSETGEPALTTGAPGLSFITAPGVSVGTRQYTNWISFDTIYPPASNWQDANAGFFTLSGEAVPEPGTTVLMVAGIVVLGCARRFRTC